MKATKNFRGHTQGADAEDLLKRAAKLEPIKKSGKERISKYSSLEEDDDDIDLGALRKRDSILDYFDD